MSKDGKDVAKQLDELRRELRADLRTLKESVKFCSDTTDNILEIQKDLKELKGDMKKLIDKNVELERENQRLHAKVDELEQYQRLNNLEIKGLPTDCDELEVVKEIGRKLNEAIDESDIDICHKIDTPNSTVKNVLVRFTRRSKRNEILAKARKARLSTESLGFRGPSKPVFVNEHLTRKNKQLLGAAIARKKVVQWKFVWSSNGKIFARRAESTPIIRITSLTDVDRMTPLT